ncbi:glutamine amidotransferase [Wickerhamomyces ciferrii]|uniref:Imidazole glycerol phosphate synthase hisHF n=1 Tax=Wickerhamomyces ciferrii (strain ATCC 14091 / BCRC 22168 / CBS 111 / JCM 3599 / NBRC 0793 / NRRL Y-1031 F-60-10) TaxID=1206466 RepID=K0KX10_WICCF|nr:glutamine amidotransferase [Wickerhamomyces ciferrii]CCH46029.1 glutamine amidotransferase [Wickerhamomyces ciferrii]
MSNIVHIIDVESGNLRSLQNAVEYLGYETKLIKDSTDPELQSATKLLLPGVGNYGHFVSQLSSKGFVQPIKEYIASGRPIMGICVGLQAFFEGSEESPNDLGLEFIDFKLSKFNSKTKSVPAIGWNSVSAVGDKMLYHIDPNNRYYFVHSYAAILNDELKSKLASNGWEIAITKYGDEEFIAAISKGNIFATQFHPEKSGIAGLKIIKAFLDQETHSDLPKLTSPNDYSNNGLTRRVIACLDVRTNDQGDLVVTKGDQYDVREKDAAGGDVKNLGKPVSLAEKYYKQGADEVTFLNITSFRNSPVADQPMLDVLKLAAKTIFVPLTVGGGIKDVVDPDGTKIPALQVAGLYFRSGADKVSIGTDAVIAAKKYYENGSKGDGTTPIETISKAYGVQAVVISVDPKRQYVQTPQDTKNTTFKTKFPGPNGEEYVWYPTTIKGGRETTDLGAYELVQACEALGAGEVLLNCIDKDGSNSGFDLELIDHIKSAVSIPVIASSGAGKPEHFAEVFQNTKTDAALGAGMFHRDEYTVKQVKVHLREQGLQARLDEETL